MGFPGAQPLGAFGNYRLLKRIARGGMAEIFLALLHGKAGFEKVVVLKRVLPELAGIDEFIHTFLDEARLAARLDHPNIARIYELGEVQGQYYLAMEYLAGEDLASLIQQCRRGGKEPPIEVAAEIGLAVAEGLAFAHGARDAAGQPLAIVHRDVSPSNVVATYLGQVKLIDFGIARAESNLLKTGAGGKPKGKVQYMAPEQAAGGTVDQRSDIFSAGVVLHELLTTQRLFRRATDEETLQAVLAADAPPPSLLRPAVPATLDRICARALARDPAARYPTAAELAADLRGVLPARGRSEPLIAAFMAEVFPPDRRDKKLRISHGMPLTEEQAEVTPVLTFDGLTPIRTNPRRAAVETVAEKKAAPLVAPAPALLPRPPPPAPPAPPAPAPPATVPRVVPPRRSWSGVLAPLLLVAGFGLGVVFMKWSAPAPVVVPPVVLAAPPPPVAAEAPSPPPAQPAATPEPAAESAPEPAAESAPSVAARPRPQGHIEVECQPWCEITLDGRATGKTSPAKLTVTPGPHHLMLANPPLGAAHELDVDVEANGTARAKATFP